MDRNRLFKPVVLLMLFIFSFYLFIQKFHWDYSIWWIDMLMHFLGGFWQGIFFLWYFSVVNIPFLRRPVQDINTKTLWYVLSFVLFVGVCWEAGEFLTSNYIGREPFSIIDTISDIFMDLAGGASAIIYAFKKIMPKQDFKVQSK